MKLLIIEDEKELSNSIAAYLCSEKYTCETAYDYNTAMEKIQLYHYSCIVLDLSLPYGSGLDILRKVKAEQKPEGIIIISARNSMEDRVKGLQIGADDFLSKPFHLAELEARIGSVIRRKSFDGNNRVVLDKLVLDIQEKQLIGQGGKIDLTRMEYMLLEYFVANSSKVITKEAIAEHLCGDDIDLADNHDFIYTHIKNLRRKLSQAGSRDNIKTVYGMGYKFYTT